MKKVKVLAFLVASLLVASAAWGEALLAPGDFIIAIDEDGIVAGGSYPGAEAPPNILDGDPGTKYLNRVSSGSGFIVTPQAALAVGSFTITTANDAEGRDPATWELYGTNDPITSADNSAGTAENWTLIAAGDVNLPAERLTVGPAVNVNSTETYASFKMIFPRVKGSNLMQIADVAFYLFPDAQGPNVLGVGDAIIAIRAGWQSNYPANEAPANAIDANSLTKYLNFGEINSGFIVTPQVGATLLDGFDCVTANDSPERDPVVWMIYGTNDDIVTPDNGDGQSENWTLICGGTMALPDERYTPGPLYVVANQAEAYTSYKMVFETVKDAAAANSMQIADVQFFGILAPPVEEPEPEPEPEPVE
ncbi:MAG: hypothetical protein JW993_21085 [Sedimentisphaerales bacterium]|nr:hypothetical protein [Sedimentisphaerales bacterium]